MFFMDKCRFLCYSHNVSARTVYSFPRLRKKVRRMKKTSWIALILFSAAAAALRAVQCRTGFDESGLPAGGVPLRAAVPCVLLLAAAYFVLSARGLSANRGACGGLSENFHFSGNTAAAACAITGAFLVMAGAAASAAGRGSLRQGALVLAVVGAAGAVCVLYAVFALYRDGGARGTAQLVPVCALVVYLIFLYRADASDPVLAGVYVELLALAALTYSALERAAFAFQNGAPRLYLPVGALSVVLALAAAAECRSLAAVLLLAGCAFVELGFLAAAEFKA